MSARDIDLEASASIILIASKYIVASVVAVAIGAVSLVYGILTYFVYGTYASSAAIFMGLFIGLALILIGVFLTFWGLYWMRSEGKRLKQKLEKRPQ
ncbi:MAG: hypothetical protein Q6366_004810 [Candidatus Freyarchaeota archaeon]|nr:hypothetical protein [Candidatus Jordarchaeia archaeon]MBS7267467.1 hypothetical protein [Candidatus Jordarchaeia archaeon]MBS7279372.1 hypothetical protein [Candidatus Jordarchaeia archaeon]